MGQRAHSAVLNVVQQSEIDTRYTSQVGMTIIMIKLHLFPSDGKQNTVRTKKQQKIALHAKARCWLSKGWRGLGRPLQV